MQRAGPVNIPNYASVLTPQEIDVISSVQPLEVNATWFFPDES
jgi:hypothetical protein